MDVKLFYRDGTPTGVAVIPMHGRHTLDLGTLVALAIPDAKINHVYIDGREVRVVLFEHVENKSEYDGGWTEILSNLYVSDGTAKADTEEG